MVNYCVCAGCTNSCLSGHRVHHFPSRKSKAFRPWVRFVQVKRADFSAASVTMHSVICSAHFTPENYRPGDLLESRMGFRSKDHVRLMTNAVPSVHSKKGPPPSKFLPESVAGGTRGPSAGTSRNSVHRKRAVSGADELTQKTDKINHKQACIDLERATQVIIRMLQTDEITQHTHKQACTDLDKATKVITQALLCEASSNGKLSELIRRLEEKEAETEQSLAEQVESNQQMRVIIDELQKRLEEKDGSLSKAKQTVAILEDEVRELHQQLQSQQCNFRRNHKVSEWLQGGKSQLTPEEMEDRPRSPLQSGQLNVQVFEFKKEAQDDEYDGSRPDEADLRTEETFTAAVMKTELMQEQEDKPNIVPVLCSQTDLSPVDLSPVDLSLVDPASLAQFPRVSVVLVDCCRTQGLKDNTGNGDAEQPEARRGSSPPSSPASPSISRTTTEQSNKYSCSVCGETFSLRSGLRLHCCADVGESPSSCFQCGKSFTVRASLKHHSYAYTGDRPYHCTQCGKTFTAERNLRKHRRVHTGERCYPCTLCSKRFTYLGGLKRHQSIHTGDGTDHHTQCNVREREKSVEKK